MSATAPRWSDALTAAALLAVDPAGLGGAVVHARHGPVRDAWLATLRALLPEGVALRRLPPGIADERLLGGLDLAATLSAGRPVSRGGLLAEADGGLVLLPMAERAEDTLVGRLGATLDTGRVRAEREGLSLDAPARIAVVALDESEAGAAGVAEALSDRLAFRLDLDGLSCAEATPSPLGPADIAAARAALPALAGAEAGEAALATTAFACAIPSLRAPMLAARAARALRALYGAALSADEAAEIAARLVIAPRAQAVPPQPEPEEEEDTEAEPAPSEETPAGQDPPDREADTDDTPGENGPAPERVLEATRAAMPAGLLAGLAGSLAPRQRAEAGRAGAARRAPDRGRPIGARPGMPGGRARLDVVETLRSAAPWQTLRRRESGRPDAPVLIRSEDFRIRRFKRRTGTTTIFAVDASGSSAVARLAEAKGAIELLLAEAYVRRDRVALVAFRGQGAEVLLPPTQSPALARKRLAALPGGGGTPMAAGLEAALALAERVRAGGTAPFLILLTDGGANIARDGTQGRAHARADAEGVARAIAAAAIPALVIDTAPRPRRETEDLARAMAARHLPMPRADAGALSRVARASAEG